MKLLVTQVSLLIAVEHQPLLLTALRAALPQFASNGSAPAQEAAVLLPVLSEQGWQAHLDADGRLAVSGYQGRLLTVEEDPTLAALLERSLPGSLVQGYSTEPAYVPWQLRKTTEGIKRVKGYLTFPGESSFTRARNALVRVQQVGTPEDLAALSSLRAQPVRLEEGEVLFSQRGSRLLAFLQYRAFTCDASTAVVIALVTRPNEALEEQARRLLSALQSRFRRLLLAPALLPLHEAVQPLGFELVQDFQIWGWISQHEGSSAPRSALPQAAQERPAIKRVQAPRP